MAACGGTQLQVDAGQLAQWRDLNGTLRADTAVYSFTLQQSVTLVATVSNACGSRADTLEIITWQAPVIELGPDQVILAGDSVHLGVEGAGASLLWQDGAGNVLQSGGDSLIFAPDTSLYVWLTATSEENCRATDSVFIEVEKPTHGLQPVVENLQVFPQPARNQLRWQLQLAQAQPLRWRVVNLQGLEMAAGTQPVQAFHAQRLVVRNWAAGLYLLCLETPDGRLSQLLWVNP